LAAAVVVAATAQHLMVAMVDRAAELADSLVRRPALGRLVRATMADRLALMRSHIVEQVVVARLRSALTAMPAVALVVRVTPTTVRHTLAVAAVAQPMSVALPAVVALAALAVTASRRLATTEQRARDLVVVVPVALALDRAQPLAVMAAMVLL